MVVYLMEELGDARLRCEDVKGYVDRARVLCDNSTHRDHLIEVAGDIVHGLPEALLKLDKALAATAMAAARMDYEIMASELRPQKADELDAVMTDLRQKRLPRKSAIMNKHETSKRLSVLAKVIRACNCMAPAGALLAHEIKGLEGGVVASLGEAPEGMPVASNPEVASQVVEQIAGTLANDSPPPPREVAAALRKVLSDSHDNPLNRSAARLWKLATTKSELGEGLVKLGCTVDQAKVTVRARFHAGKPADPTSQMSEEDAQTWREMNDKYKDVVKNMHQASEGSSQQQAQTAQPQEQKQSGAGEEFQKHNPGIDDEEAAEIDRQHEKNKDVVKDQHKEAASDDNASSLEKIEADLFSMDVAVKAMVKEAGKLSDASGLQGALKALSKCYADVESELKKAQSAKKSASAQQPYRYGRLARLHR